MQCELEKMWSPGTTVCENSITVIVTDDGKRAFYGSWRLYTDTNVWDVVYRFFFLFYFW